MIRKARNQSLEMSASDPTPEEIRQRSESIRRQWTPRERVRRSGIRPAGWMPPVFSEGEFPGYTANEFESR